MSTAVLDHPATMHDTDLWVEACLLCDSSRTFGNAICEACDDGSCCID